MTTKRYTEQELRNLAGLYGGELHEALKQAAEDCERLARVHALASDPKESFEELIDAIERESRDTARTQEKARD